MLSTNKIISFMAEKHKDQKRKFSGVPYMVHCVRCYITTRDLFPFNFVLQRAMTCHDTLEDTDCTYDELVEVIGVEAADVVVELTNVYEKKVYPDLNRKQRKELEFKRLSTISDDAKCGKLIDRLDNLGEMGSDGDFLQTYLKESQQLLKAVGSVNNYLESELNNTINLMYDIMIDKATYKAINRR